ncbi:hypothetical protein JCM33374_g2529 [Metschnikowia sp. JCM 33374]|nr:hypothetical protein JCM33374_g2529 [Metschnikowia sp. JCM 33374]
MFAVNAIHESKSRSTQSLCKESATACIPSKDDDLVEIAKLKLSENVESRKSSDTTLAEGFRDLHLSRVGLENERSFSIDSSSSLTQIRLAEFNSSLTKFHDSDMYVISSPEKLKQLLDLHHSIDNPMPPSSDMFPYLHGPTSLREKVYFDERFDPVNELHFLTEDSQTISRRFPPNSFAKAPDSTFHLMTVNSQGDDNPYLVNSIVIEDLLTFKQTTETFLDADSYDCSNLQQFNEIDHITNQPCTPSAQTNRNFRSQIKLMAPISHFLVYNNDMNLSTTIEVARIIEYLRGPDSSKCIYLVDFAPCMWPKVGRYLDQPLNQSHPDKDIKLSAYGSTSTPKRLCSLEQNLVWSVYNITQLFPHLYVGNILSFKQLISSSVKSSHYDFKLFIYCHENAHMPSMDSLHQTMRDLDKHGLRTPIFLEFSDSILRHGASMSKDDTLSYLNLMRIINIIVNKAQKNVLVYSYDGFTDTSLLLLSLGLFWGCDHIEEVSLCLFRKPEVKFHLCQGDFPILKNIEVYLQWFKRLPAKDTNLLVDLPLEKIYTNYRPYIRPTDWFRADNEINFPAFIYENLLLGSVNHASSITVLSTLKVTKVISIGEKPRWFSALNCTFSHDATSSVTGPVIEPIFRFNNGRSLVYEVKITSPAMRAQLFRHGAVPHLKSFIYIHGLEDDGRDSIIPLLVDCPEWVQSKLLVAPGEPGKSLVHCRIGVSRSATLAIASVMKHFQMSLVESFLYVRVRRFNVVIQPNLRLFYELFLYNEHLRLLRSQGNATNEPPACWWTLCAEIHRLNSQYTG